MAGEDDSHSAQPSVYRGRRDLPVVDSFRLEVDREVFDVEVQARRDQHRESIRNFLSMIGPATGYISDD